MPDSPAGKRTSGPRNYQSYRERRRLLAWVLSLGLMAILLFQPNLRSKLVRWVKSFSEAPPADKHGDAPRHADEKIDPRVRVQPEAPLPADTVIIRPNQAPSGAAPVADLFPGIDGRLLTEVKDHTYFRSAETPAWQNVMQVLRETELPALEKAARKDITYGQLFRQPQLYRGRLLTMRGVVKRSFDIEEPVPGATNGERRKYYQLWFFADNGQKWPLVIYSTELPPGFPTSRVPGDDKKVRNLIPGETVEVTGVFFKDWYYSTGADLISAPVLLAKNVRWQKRPPPKPTVVPVGLIAGIACGIAAIAVIVSWRVYKMSQSMSAGRRPELPAELAPLVLPPESPVELPPSPPAGSPPAGGA